MPPVRVLAIDDHPSVIRGIEEELARVGDEFTLIGAHTHPDDVDLDATPAEIVVLDVRLDADGTSTTLPWIERFVAWGAHVLLHTSEERPVTLREAVRLGACGMCLKLDDSLTEALRHVRDDGYYVSSEWADTLLNDAELVPALTPREIEVLEGLQDGLDQRLVARRLDISAETVRTHLRAATTKYRDARGTDKVRNTIGVLREARRDGWIGPD